MARITNYLTPILWIYGIFSVTCLVLAAIVAVLILILPINLRVRRNIVRTFARFWFFITATPIHLTGAEHLTSSPSVVVANHASYLDGIILQAVLPVRFGFVIKREVTQVPLVHFLLRRIGSQFVERRNRYRSGQDAKRIVEHAKAGRSVAVFPEGTFIAKPGLGRFRPGAFAAAVAGQVSVVPVVIEGSRSMLSADHWLPRPGRLRVTVLAPLAVQGEGRDAMKDIAKRSRETILSVLREPDLEHSIGDGQPY